MQSTIRSQRLFRVASPIMLTHLLDGATTLPLDADNVVTHPVDRVSRSFKCPLRSTVACV
eukprot:scaffold30_cov416-Prasinococcus_capsulatus_cf.AAC.4